jgi:hypothetical protein
MEKSVDADHHVPESEGVVIENLKSFKVKTLLYILGASWGSFAYG